MGGQAVLGTLRAGHCSRGFIYIDRGRRRLSPSPPSEPCVRFSRTRLSSRWFPHRDWLASPQIAILVNNPYPAKKTLVSLDAVTQRRQHALHSLRGFNSLPVRPVSLCVLSSPCGHYRRLLLALHRCDSHPSTFLPPVPRRSFALCASRGFNRFGTMKALTPAPLTTHSAGLPAYLAIPSCRSVSNHVGLPDHRLPPRQRDQRVSDFALSEQARRSTSAESSSFAYGPTVRLRLLSTPLRADAVTFSYEAVAYSGTDFHRANVAPLRAHSPPNVFIGGPVPVSPGFPLKA